MKIKKKRDFFKRELVVFKPTHSKLDVASLIQKMINETQILELQPNLSEVTKKWTNPEDQQLWFYIQKKIQSSRKQIQPLVAELLEKSSLWNSVNPRDNLRPDFGEERISYIPIDSKDNAQGHEGY